MDEQGNLAAVRRLEDDELARLRAINRRWWGSTMVAVGIALLVAFIAMWVVLLWLWSIAKDSPTIS